MNNINIIHDKNLISNDLRQIVLEKKDGYGKNFFKQPRTINNKINISVLTGFFIDHDISTFITDLIDSGEEYYVILFYTSSEMLLWIYDDQENRDNAYLKLKQNIKFRNLLDE